MQVDGIKQYNNAGLESIIEQCENEPLITEHQNYCSTFNCEGIRIRPQWFVPILTWVRNLVIPSAVLHIILSSRHAGFLWKSISNSGAVEVERDRSLHDTGRLGLVGPFYSTI